MVNVALVKLTLAITVPTWAIYGLCVAQFNVAYSLTLDFINISVWSRYNVEPSSEALNWVYGFLTSSLWIGGWIGLALSGFIGRRLGPKTAMTIVLPIVTICGCLLDLFAKVFTTIELLLLARCTLGVAVGFVTVLCPVYLVECSPPHYAVYSLHVSQVLASFWCVVGGLLSLPHVVGNFTLWPVYSATLMIVAVLLLLQALWLPETPRFLAVERKKFDSAKCVLWTLYGSERGVLFDAVLRSLQDEMDRQPRLEALNSRVGVCSALFREDSRPLLALFVVTAAANVLVGPAFLLTYSAIIMEKISEDKGLRFSVVLTVTSFVGALISLVFVEHAKRHASLVPSLAASIVANSVFLIFASIAKNSPATQHWATPIYVALLCFATFASNVGPTLSFWALTVKLESLQIELRIKRTIFTIATALQYLMLWLLLAVFPTALQQLDLYAYLALIIGPSIILAACTALLQHVWVPRLVTRGDTGPRAEDACSLLSHSHERSMHGSEEGEF